MIRFFIILSVFIAGLFVMQARAICQEAKRDSIVADLKVDSLRKMVLEVKSLPSFIISNLSETGTPIISIDSVSLVKRHKKGEEALKRIIREIATVNQVLRGSLITSHLGFAANPWNDEDFRNLWDQVEGFGTTLGLGAATYLALKGDRDPEKRVESIGWSLMLAAGSKILGTVFGNQMGVKFENKTPQIEFTRRAYDHLQTVYILTEAEVKSNEELMNEIKKFLDNDYKNATTSDKCKEVIQKGAFYLDRFDLVLAQIPAFIQRYKQVIDTFCPSAISALEKDEKAEFDCKILEKEQPYYIKGQAKENMRNAAKHLIGMKKEEADAIEARRLASELRDALVRPF